MDRKELHTALIQSGKYHRADIDFPLWKQALEAYKKDSGDRDANLACGSCVNKVKKWLER